MDVGIVQGSGLRRIRGPFGLGFRVQVNPPQLVIAPEYGVNMALLHLQ